MPFGTIYSVGVDSTYASIAYLWKTVHKLALELKIKHSKEKFDILNIHAGFPILSLITFLLPPTLELPVVFTLYCNKPKMLNAQNLKKYITFLIPPKLVFSKVCKVMTLSEKIGEFVKREGIHKSKVVLLPPPIDTERFNPRISGFELRKKLGFDDNTPMILFFGNWNPWKGVATFIESMPIILLKNPEAKFVLACGDKIDWQAHHRLPLIRRIKQLNLTSNVIELGLVENIERLIGASDVVVVPFLNIDGIADRPLTVLEAMACGKPIVATRVGGIPEIIEDGVNGLLVDPRDSYELGKSVCTLIEDKRLDNELGKNAAYHVKSNYNLMKITRILEEVYEDVLNIHSNGL